MSDEESLQKGYSIETVVASIPNLPVHLLLPEIAFQLLLPL
jgi:hypothetical protein